MSRNWAGAVTAGRKGPTGGHQGAGRGRRNSRREVASQSVRKVADQPSHVLRGASSFAARHDRDVHPELFRGVVVGLPVSRGITFYVRRRQMDILS